MNEQIALIIAIIFMTVGFVLQGITIRLVYKKRKPFDYSDPISPYVSQLASTCCLLVSFTIAMALLIF